MASHGGGGGLVWCCEPRAAPAGPSCRRAERQLASSGSRPASRRRCLLTSGAPPARFRRRSGHTGLFVRGHRFRAKHCNLPAGGTATGDDRRFHVPVKMRLKIWKCMTWFVMGGAHCREMFKAVMYRRRRGCHHHSAETFFIQQKLLASSPYGFCPNKK